MSNARFSIIQAKAVQDQRVTDSQLRTLNALGIFSDKDGWCFPKQSTIGEIVGKNQQNVSKDIQKLVELGYVQSYPQYDQKTGARMQNKYRLLFDTPLSSERDDTPTPPRRVDNAPLNVPYNTASGENQPSAEIPDSFPIEWQVAGGKKKIAAVDNGDAEYIDAANLIATGMGGLADYAFAVSLAFMRVRGIVIPKTGYNKERKAVKELDGMNVQPEHIEEATRQLMSNPKLTGIVSLHSVKNVAFGLANPVPEEGYSGSIEGV